MLYCLFLFILNLAHAQNYQTHCQQFPTPLPGGFCIHKPENSLSKDVLYYLHGNGGSQTTWQESVYYTQQIRQYWSDTQKQPPTIVSISFGPTWLLVEKNSKPESGLYNVVTEQLIPLIEKQLGGLHGQRLLLGESMGGVNSIQLALKTKLFHKAAILCAPISPISPFSPIADIFKYVESTAAWEYYKKTNPKLVYQSAEGAVEIAQAFIPTPDEWNKADPLLLAQTSTSQTSIYLAAGYYDSYGAYEGNILFYKALKNNHRNVQWRPQWGGHCAIDIPSLADFLVL